MKFSENWLRQHVKTTATRDELAATLTAIGLEVEELTPLGEALDGVVVARICPPRSIPQADRCRSARSTPAWMRRCRSSAVRPTRARGWWRRWPPSARPWATLTIKAAKLRGVDSNGMLCSAKELGIDADASGLLELPDDAPVGTPLADYLGLPDAAIELKLTPNRADCFGVRGIAFDVAAATGCEVEPLQADAGAGCHRQHDGGGTARGQRCAALRRPRDRGRGPGGKDAGVDGQRLRAQRRASGQLPGRRHPVRDARARPADACVRPRPAQGPGRRAPCARG